MLNFNKNSGNYIKYSFPIDVPKFFNQPIGNWDTSMQPIWHNYLMPLTKILVAGMLVTMTVMFNNARQSKDVGGWDVSNVTDMNPYVH